MGIRKLLPDTQMQEVPTESHHSSFFLSRSLETTPCSDRSIFYRSVLLPPPPQSVLPLFIFLCLFLDKTWIQAASLGVCFHISEQEKCSFCSKVTELPYLQLLSGFTVCVCVYFSHCAVCLRRATHTVTKLELYLGILVRLL